MEKYLNDYFKVLKSFYASNKLHLNDEKTGILVVHKPNKNKQIKIQIKDNQTVIEPKKTMKILGWKYSEENNMKQQASDVVSSVSFYIQKIKHMSRFMPLKVRLVYANAMLMSRVKYG